MFTSLAVHVGLFILLLLPLMKFQVPPPGQQGILVSFGNPEMGQGDDRPATQMEEEVEPLPPQEEAVEQIQEEQPPEEVIEETEEETFEEAAAEPESAPEESQKEVVTAEDPDAAAIKKAEEEKKKAELEAEKKAEVEAKKKADLEAKKKAEEEARKKKTEAEAKAKAEAEAKKKAEYEEAKKQFGDVFGEGKGKTDAPGNQGDPNGDPDASRLEGISTGSGVVGDGLGDRGVLYTPKIEDSSQKTGKVVIRVCVNSAGDVVEARFTQRGSTTADGELVKVAIENSKKFRFSKGSIDKQCGTITIDFKVR